MWDVHGKLENMTLMVEIRLFKFQVLERARGTVSGKWLLNLKRHTILVFIMLNKITPLSLMETHKCFIMYIMKKKNFLMLDNSSEVKPKYLNCLSGDTVSWSLIHTWAKQHVFCHILHFSTRFVLASFAAEINVFTASLAQAAAFVP